MRSFAGRCILGVMAGVLLVATGGIVYRACEDLPPARGNHLSALLPADLPGFSARDEPLGLTERVEEKVASALNFDDHVYRVYRRGQLEVAIYVAYWVAGKMPIRDVAQHTPDRCWTDNGFVCIETKFEAELGISDFRLRPGDYRTFETPREGQKIWVAFWLMAGGDRYDFGRNFNPLVDPTEWFKSAFKNMRLGRRELYFVRISANQPLESIESDPSLQQLADALGRLNLGR